VGVVVGAGDPMHPARIISAIVRRSNGDFSFIFRFFQGCCACDRAVMLNGCIVTQLAWFVKLTWPSPSAL
jgi:hypothetical protein